jgi:site-specific DNA-methyltransferase (adenine-specific)
VKGGRNISPSFVRDLVGTADTQRAQTRVLVIMTGRPRGVTDAANHGGVYTRLVNGQTFPRVQVITVADLLAGRRPSTPQLMLPYVAAPRRVPVPAQMDLFGGSGDWMSREGYASNGGSGSTP